MKLEKNTSNNNNNKKQKNKQKNKTNRKPQGIKGKLNLNFHLNFPCELIFST